MHYVLTVNRNGFTLDRNRPQSTRRKVLAVQTCIKIGRTPGTGMCPCKDGFDQRCSPSGPMPKSRQDLVTLSHMPYLDLDEATLVPTHPMDTFGIKGMYNCKALIFALYFSIRVQPRRIRHKRDVHKALTRPACPTHSRHNALSSTLRSVRRPRIRSSF